MAASRDRTRPADTSTGSPTAAVPAPGSLNNVNPTKASLGLDTPTPSRPASKVENRTTRLLRSQGKIT